MHYKSNCKKKGRRIKTTEKPVGRKILRLLAYATKPSEYIAAIVSHYGKPTAIKSNDSRLALLKLKRIVQMV